MMAESEARKTLSQSCFFLDQALAVETTDRTAFEHFIAAAIVFGRSATFHLQKEYSARHGFEEWYSAKQAQMAADPLFSFLRDKRNYILKEASIPVRKTVSVSLSGNVMMSGHLEARVIRGQPWYRRRPYILLQDTNAAIGRIFRRFSRFLRNSARRMLPRRSKKVATTTLLHFDDDAWRDQAATDVISEYLRKLEAIVADAERQFPAAPVE